MLVRIRAHEAQPGMVVVIFHNVNSTNLIISNVMSSSTQSEGIIYEIKYLINFCGKTPYIISHKFSSDHHLYVKDWSC